jgi:hypothetical protein
MQCNPVALVGFSVFNMIFQSDLFFYLCLSNNFSEVIVRWFYDSVLIVSDFFFWKPFWFGNSPRNYTIFKARLCIYIFLFYTIFPEICDFTSRGVYISCDPIIWKMNRLPLAERYLCKKWRGVVFHEIRLSMKWHTRN